MTNKKTPALVHNEQGIALVLSLFLIAAMSVIGASLMVLSQTETFSSANYRLMSQARYGAESGIQVAVNYLLNTYTAPGGSNFADPLSNYDMTVSPVKSVANGQPVVLSAVQANSNYPVPAVATGFSTATTGSLPAGRATITYSPTATLMSMQQINTYGGGVKTIQTWQITSDGTISTNRTSTVQVTATLESQKVAATTYGAFATNPGCGALTFGGNGSVDSYDSTSALVAGVPAIANNTGNVGTNGNLGGKGTPDIWGTLSTPRVGVGSCSAGNVDACSAKGNSQVCPDYPTCKQQGIMQLPQTVALPTPTVPTGVPTTAYVGNNQTLHNGDSVGNVTINTGTLTLCDPGATCTINVNSINLAGNATIAIAPGAIVTLNVVGQGVTTPIDLTGGSTLNASFDPTHFQILYAGTNQVYLGGNTSLTAMVYMPNAPVELRGNMDFYGAIVASTLNVSGNAPIHYDRHLETGLYGVSNSMMTAFSWNKS